MKPVVTPVAAAAARVAGERDVMLRDAHLSEDGLFRFVLTRLWNATLPVLVFVMLNPSTADGSVDDPTIRKCIGFAVRNGYGSIQVFNLFAYRATKPAALRAAGYPTANGEDVWIKYAAHCGDVVCAWGVNAMAGVPAVRAREVIKMLQAAGGRLKAIRLTAKGIPCHPLTMPYGPLIEYAP